jgi:hypothetical protein
MNVAMCSFLYHCDYWLARTMLAVTAPSRAMARRWWLALIQWLFDAGWLPLVV